MKLRSTDFPWRILLALWCAVAVVTPLFWPYAEGLIAIAPHPPGLPENAGLVLLLRNLIAAAVMLPIGLYCARRVGLQTPYLDFWLYRRAIAEPVSRLITRSGLWSIGLSITIIAVDLVFFLLLSVNHPAPEVHARIPGLDAWRGFPIAFYAGITAELHYRLFAMSLLAWIAISLSRAQGGRGRSISLWIANFGAAVFYVHSYLPGVEMFGPVSDPVLLRTCVMLLPVGLAFGYLYMKHGLETAIACHFFTDIVIHVIRPLLDPGA